MHCSFGHVHVNPVFGVFLEFDRINSIILSRTITYSLLYNNGTDVLSYVYFIYLFIFVARGEKRNLGRRVAETKHAKGK